MKFFEVTKRNHWQLLAWPILFFTALLCIIPIIAINRHSGDGNALAFAIVFAILSAGSIIGLHIAIHARYNRVSKDLKIGFDSAGSEILFVRRGKERRIRDSEIANVEVNQSIASTHSSAVWLPWQSYRYVVITLVTGEKFLITSLHVPHREWPYKFKNVKTRTTNYWWPPDPDSW